MVWCGCLVGPPIVSSVGGIVCFRECRLVLHGIVYLTTTRQYQPHTSVWSKKQFNCGVWEPLNSRRWSLCDTSRGEGALFKAYVAERSAYSCKMVAIRPAKVQNSRRFCSCQF